MPREGRAPAATVATVALVCAVQAEALEAKPDTYRELLKGLEPGDELHLVGGLYLRSLAVHRLFGASSASIVIAGAASGKPAVFFASRERNTVSILDAAYVEILNLTLEGRGVAVDAAKCEGHATFAHHVTLQNLRIEGHGANQQTVGISTKCSA